MVKTLLIERVNAGLERARKEGKVKLGRPSKTTLVQQEEIRVRKTSGTSASQLARDYGVSRATMLSIAREQPVPGAI
jgi:putative DNA-invertase from lambdoid prophage Rac